MAYCDFTLAKVREAFNLVIEEDRDLFAEVPQAQPSELLSMILKEYLNLAIAINSEKSRSEFIIAPILGEIRRLSGYQVSLFLTTKISLAAWDNVLRKWSPRKYLTSNQETILKRSMVLSPVEPTGDF